ncbi:mitochondrial distribution and morphology [Coemansia sp. RSA 2599]|nr:mitochondrial distribution and morphology [Coemansia sp. RSA 2598]KAJ1828378.1 mitochondrial distribution and morphology [Coemansia sp. RSA 2599]
MRAATNECARLLSKNPNHISGKSYMSFLLATAGKLDEAAHMGRDVLNTAGSLKNPHVVRGLSLAFRALALSKEEFAVYSGCLEFSPNDLSLHTKAFMVAAYHQMYKEQHQTAVNISRLSKQDLHMWWVVASLMLEAKFCKQSSQEKQLQLTLARRMSEKALEEGKLKTTEELRLYLDVLEMQDAYPQMIDALAADGPLSAKICNDPDLVSKRIALLVKTEAYDEAIKAATDALNVRDNWIDYKNYVAAAVGKLKQGSAGPEHSAESIIESACNAFSQWAQIRGRARGAKLALVELRSSIFASGHEAFAGDAAELLGEQIWLYFDEFSPKAICYKDIMSYFVAHVTDPATNAPVQERVRFHSEQLQKRAGPIRDSAEQSEDNAQSWVNLEKVRYLIQALSDDTSPESLVDGIDELLKHGIESAQAQKKQASCSDMTLIASQRLIQAAFLAFSEPSKRAQLCASLFNALCVLEAGIKLNANSFLLKLFAIRIYLYLSCYERARALYDSLNIKNLQHDTLGFLMVGQGISLGCFVSDLETCYDGVDFYDRSKWKVPRELESVYKNGTYSNLLDYIEFHDNLVHSFQRECTHRCALRGEALEAGNQRTVVDKWSQADAVSIDHTEETLAALCDNRDTGVLSLLTPASMDKWNLEKLTRATPLPCSSWVLINSLVPQIMHCIVTSNIEQVEEKNKRLLAAAEQAGDSLSIYEHRFVRGFSQVAMLYICASDGKQSLSDQMADLTATILDGLAEPSESRNAETLSDMALSTIRNISVATEIYTYAVTVRFALNEQRSPSAKAVSLSLSQLRKTALQRMSALRSLTNSYLRGAIDEHWSSHDVRLFVPVAAFMKSKRRPIVDSVAKSCFSGWSRSVKNLAGQWEQWS